MRHVLAILGGSLLWGLAWMPIKGLAAQGLTPLAITLASYGPAALMLLPATLGRRRLWWVRRRVLGGIAATGATANLCFVAAMATGEAGHQILLYYLSTGWAIVGGRFFLRESLDSRHWASVLLAFGGAWTVLDGPTVGHGDGNSAGIAGHSRRSGAGQHQPALPTGRRRTGGRQERGDVRGDCGGGRAGVRLRPCEGP